jgi:predicted amidohydrolase
LPRWLCCDETYWRTADRQAFVAAAGRLHLGVVLGTVHWEGDELFNSLLVVDVDGTVRGRYAKTHLAERWSQAGRSLPEYKLSAYRAMPIARATENSIFLVMANAPADADDLQSPSQSQSHGNSKIVHPDGNVLVEAGFFEERLVIADVDLADATGAMALRAVEDETVLRASMQQGLALVERPV